MLNLCSLTVEAHDAIEPPNPSKAKAFPSWRIRSAGLAACGKKLFVFSPASFLSTHSMEQAKIDIVYSYPNVKLIVNLRVYLPCDLLKILSATLLGFKRLKLFWEVSHETETAEAKFKATSHDEDVALSQIVADNYQGTKGIAEVFIEAKGASAIISGAMTSAALY